MTDRRRARLISPAPFLWSLDCQFSVLTLLLALTSVCGWNRECWFRRDKTEPWELPSCFAGSMSLFDPTTGLEGGIGLTRLKLQLQAIRDRMSRQIPIYRFLSWDGDPTHNRYAAKRISGPRSPHRSTAPLSSGSPPQRTLQAPITSTQLAVS